MENKAALKRVIKIMASAKVHNDSDMVEFCDCLYKALKAVIEAEDRANDAGGAI